MAPYQPDDNVIFLHYCIMHCSGPGKIDWDAVAVAIGSTKGAAAMRYRRLKERIEQDTASPGGGSGTTQQSNATKGKKKSATSRKRKATDDNEDDADGNASVLPQVDGAADLPQRQTRGKRVHYGIFANYVSDAFTSDDELSLSSFEDGDGDFVLQSAAIKSEDEGDSVFGGESDHKPNVKRLKKPQPSPSNIRSTPTPGEKRNVAPVTPPSTVRKHDNKVTQRTTAPKKAKQLPSKIPVPSKTNVESTMHPSQQPMPSIEFSPPPTPTPAKYAKKKQSVVETESDIDIKSLRPGTILSFPAKGQPRVSSGMSHTSLSEPERFSTPITIASSVSSSHDSAGKILKQNLTEHVQQIELRPEDSISNIGHRAEEDFFIVPATPTGLVTNAVRFFKGFVTPQTQSFRSF